MTESELSEALRSEALKFKSNLYRNNSGVGRNPIGRPIRFGLGNISKKLWDVWKTSDRIGYTKVTITPDMVGRTIAVFTAVEVKLPDAPIDARYRAQEKFINQVKIDGGIASMVNSVDSLKEMFKSFFNAD